MSASPDQFLVTPIEDEKNSNVVFDVQTPELLQKNYTFHPSLEKSLAGNIFVPLSIFIIIIRYNCIRYFRIVLVLK